MSLGWSSLPLVPLRCVLEYLSTEEALAATSACRHWRTALLLYEGHKETLKLKTKMVHLEKNMFLMRLFKKYTKRLHVYIDCKEDELEEFMHLILPQFFDTVDLQELLFIGPSYIQQNQHIPVVKLKRIITESLIFKHLNNIQKLGFLGCKMDTLKNIDDNHNHKQIAQYYELVGRSTPCPADGVLSRNTASVATLSTLQHIMLDHEYASTCALETLSLLPQFTQLTLNIRYRRQRALEPIDWQRLSAHYANTLNVSVNIIALPHGKFNDVIENVLGEGMSLTSVKIMFCRTLHTPLIKHIMRYHKETLRELVWADCPHEGDTAHRLIRPVKHSAFQHYQCNVNPFILLCWQCTQLRRLVIHGYWIWQYDLLGIVRLRKTLQYLEVSAVYGKLDRLGELLVKGQNVVRVLANDIPQYIDWNHICQMNEYMKQNWNPVPWNMLHPGLRARATPEQRAQYIVQETRQALGPTPF